MSLKDNKNGLIFENSKQKALFEKLLQKINLVKIEIK
jgi:hypothetical protein